MEALHAHCDNIITRISRVFLNNVRNITRNVENVDVYCRNIFDFFDSNDDHY